VWIGVLVKNKLHYFILWRFFWSCLQSDNLLHFKQTDCFLKCKHPFKIQFSIFIKTNWPLFTLALPLRVYNPLTFCLGKRLQRWILTFLKKIHPWSHLATNFRYSTNQCKVFCLVKIWWVALCNPQVLTTLQEVSFLYFSQQLCQLSTKWIDLKILFFSIHSSDNFCCFGNIQVIQKKRYLYLKIVSDWPHLMVSNLLCWWKNLSEQRSIYVVLS